MFNEYFGHVRADQTRPGSGMILPLFLALIFAAAFSPSRTQAQIIGNLEADIPFQFHVGNTSLPAGKYTIHQLENSDLVMMEISSADGKVSALFDVEATETKSAPEKSELIFHKYGDRYFLSEMFDEGNANGNKLLESRDERQASKESGTDMAHVVARHPQQEGK
jgi:hypothetical protein